MHAKAIKGEFYDDFGDVWYNKIRKHKWMDISKMLAQEAYDYGLKRISYESSQGALIRIRLGEVMPLNDKKEKAKAYARSYIVNVWLKSIKDPKDYSKKMFTIDNLIT